MPDGPLTRYAVCGTRRSLFVVDTLRSVVRRVKCGLGIAACVVDQRRISGTRPRPTPNQLLWPSLSHILFKLRHQPSWERVFLKHCSCISCAATLCTNSNSASGSLPASSEERRSPAHVNKRIRPNSNRRSRLAAHFSISIAVRDVQRLLSPCRRLGPDSVADNRPGRG